MAPSNLCRWCGKAVRGVFADDGHLVARQCPLCLDWAPPAEDVGKERPPKKALTRAEQRVRKVEKAAQAARQGELWGPGLLAGAALRSLAAGGAASVTIGNRTYTRRKP